jgi:hypothetical protein
MVAFRRSRKPSCTRAAKWWLFLFLAALCSTQRQCRRLCLRHKRNALSRMRFVAVAPPLPTVAKLRNASLRRSPPPRPAGTVCHLHFLWLGPLALWGPTVSASLPAILTSLRCVPVPNSLRLRRGPLRR